MPKSDIIEALADEIGMAINNKTLDVIIKDILIYADTKKNSDEDKYEIMKIAQNLLKDLDKYK